MKTLKSLMLTVVLLLAWITPALAQTTTTQTTLSAAMTATATTLTVASATGFAAGTTAVFIDNEYMQVRSVSGTTITVIRQARPQAHRNGAIVYVGPQGGSGPFQAMATPFAGTCTASNYTYLPIIDTNSGGVYNCTGSRWQRVTLAPLQTTTVNYTAVADAAYTALITDEIIAYTSLSTGRTVTLPSATGLAGKVLIIKDESGSVGTNGILSLSGGPTGGSVQITTGYGSIKVYSNGTNWYVLP